MVQGEVIIVKNRDGLDSILMKADAALAAQLPALRLPTMSDEARAIFRDILKHEKPPGNGSVHDVLRLPEARGFSVHAEDWIPCHKGDGQFSRLYAPWVDWLADHDVIPYFEGNTLTRGNWSRWKPSPRTDAFKKLLRNDRAAALALIFEASPAFPAADRLQIVKDIDLSWSSACDDAWLVSVFEHFLADKSEKVRTLAQEKLAQVKARVPEEVHARDLARHLTVTASEVTYAAPHPGDYAFGAQWSGTSFNHLAQALGLTPTELAQRANLQGLGSRFTVLTILTADVGIRAIFAQRLLDANSDFADGMFAGVDAALRQRGLQQKLRSVYISSVSDYLGDKIGTLNSAMMLESAAYETVAPSIRREIESRKLPVNDQYDELRVLGLIVDKPAAKELLDKALALGLKPTNPRLNMLKFNLAL